MVNSIKVVIQLTAPPSFQANAQGILWISGYQQYRALNCLKGDKIIKYIKILTLQHRRKYLQEGCLLQLLFSTYFVLPWHFLQPIFSAHHYDKISQIYIAAFFSVCCHGHPKTLSRCYYSWLSLGHIPLEVSRCGHPYRKKHCKTI